MPPSAALLQTALSHHQAGQWDVAEAAYRKILAVNAGDSDALRLLGALCLQNGRWAPAAEFLGQAVVLRPEDAETCANWGIALCYLGQNEAAVAALSRTLVLNPNHLLALTHLAQSYQALGQEEEAIACFHRALKIDPDHLAVIYDLAMALSQAARGEEAMPYLTLAQDRLEKLCKAEAGNLDAFNRCGTILQRLGRLDEAADYYRHALQKNPDFVPATANLSVTLRDLCRFEEAIEKARDALRLMPHSVDACINLGLCLQSMMRHDEALDAFNQALHFNPNSLVAKRNKTFSLLALGHYQEGFALHEAGIGVASMRGHHPFPERRWNGENIKGKRLLIWCEQGLGDDLQFIRYAELCKEKGCTVIVQCPHILRRLLANCPFIDSLPQNIGETDFDFHAPMMSLPYIFATTLDSIPATIPYLYVSEATQDKWRPKFDCAEKFKIGFVWAGKSHETHTVAHLIDQRRSIDLSLLQPLFTLPGFTFYSLQLGSSAAQIDKYHLRNRIIDYTQDIIDFEDTAALIQNLDLVITVDTSVAHLAGGLGRPVWILSRFDCDWRWLQNRIENPWYPSARIFGQQSPDDWRGVIEKLSEALKKIMTAYAM